MGYSKNRWIEDGLTEAQKVNFLNNLETTYDATIADVLNHIHDTEYYTKALADARFFGPSHQGTGSGMNAGTLDGYASSDIVSSSIPSGLIVMYAGTGYVLPDGWVGDNDIETRFPVGAGVTYALKQTGGNNTSIAANAVAAFSGTALSEYQIPIHSHTFTEYYNGPTQYRKNDSNAHVCQAAGTQGTNTDNCKDANGNYGGNQPHSHDCSISVNSLDHTPPYVSIAFIKKS